MWKEGIVDFLRSGIKDDETLTYMGVEIEHFLVDRETQKSMSYFDKHGIEYLLNELVAQCDWEVFSQEGASVLGIANNTGTITVEPGGQLELSLHPKENISDIGALYTTFREQVSRIIDPLGLELVNYGYHPKSKIEDIPFNPKERYQYMSEYLGERGSMAHNMMKGSASIQVAIDYFSEDDFSKKFIVASKLSPILSLLFDNSPVFEGELWQGHCLRTNIWINCDGDRCGVPSSIFAETFTFSDYAEYVLNVPPIFMPLEDSYVFTKDKHLSMMDDFTVSKASVEHVLGMVFPDVRAKSYIEIRMIDSVDIEYVEGFLAIVKGLFYNEDALNRCYNLLAHANIDEYNEVKNALISGDDNVLFMGRTCYEWGLTLIELVSEVLTLEEQKYLKSLDTLWRNNTTLKKEYKRGLKIDE